MLILSALLLVAGLVMFLKPDLVWLVTESWKSDDATGPSDLFRWSTRFGGVLCALAGLGGAVAWWLLPR